MKVPATAFKANCLQLMSRVANSRDKVVITKRGKPIAQLVPVEQAPDSLFGYMKGTVTVKGDIVSSLSESWSVRDGDEDHLYTVKSTPKKRVTRKRKST
jgi:prevent-host-death family protein